MDTDVLIVGAGPTGLMLANQLNRLGVRVTVVERNAGPARETRALGVQARTLEIYAQLGLAERAIELGKQGTGANLWARGRHTARVPLGDAGRELTPYPYILVLGQDDNEKLLGERLRTAGVQVQWQTELTRLDTRDDGVVATLRGADGNERSLHAGWVAGCDGAHSAVRHLLGVDFPGAPYEHVFFVADVKSRGPMVADELNVYLWQSGFHLFFPMRGEDHWRIVGILPDELRGRNDVTFDQVTGDLERQIGPRFDVEICTWFATYRIHHRSAERFYQSRCFLLGDAAHIHSPVGAQGMNTGLQDACNLAWKLARVVQGKADERLLETYDSERRAIARRLLETTDRAFRLVVADGWFAGLMRTRVVARVAALLMSRPAIQRAAFRIVSQLAVHYRQGSLSLNGRAFPKSAPQAGDRFPWLRLQLAGEPAPVDLFQRLTGLTFTLVLFGQSVPTSLAGDPRFDVVTVPDSAFNASAMALAEIPPRAFFLVRPDGYVGACGTDVDAGPLDEWFERVSLRR